MRTMTHSSSLESSTELRVPRVLVVDDDELVARVLSRSLSRKGVLVTVAHSAAEAVKLCDERPFDLVITDQNMPRVTGTELIAILHEVHGMRRFVLCTGMGEPPLLPVAGVKLLPKPWSAADLEGALGDLLADQPAAAEVG